jgi:hypothetical protein
VRSLQLLSTSATVHAFLQGFPFDWNMAWLCQFYLKGVFVHFGLPQICEPVDVKEGENTPSILSVEGGGKLNTFAILTLDVIDRRVRVWVNSTWLFSSSNRANVFIRLRALEFRSLIPMMNS